MRLASTATDTFHIPTSTTTTTQHNTMTTTTHIHTHMGRTVAWCWGNNIKHRAQHTHSTTRLTVQQNSCRVSALQHHQCREQASRVHRCCILLIADTAHPSPAAAMHALSSCSLAIFPLRSYTLAGSPPAGVHQATCDTALCC
jgi:hypothetical protein